MSETNPLSAVPITRTPSHPLTHDALADQLDHVVATMNDALGTLPAELLALQQRIEAIKAPFQYEIDTLKTLLTQTLIDQGVEKTTIKRSRMTFAVFPKATWDSKLLDAMARELPQITQAKRITQQCQMRLL